MKIVSCSLAILIAGWVLYELFKPVLGAPFGWTDLPKDISQVRFVGKEADEFSVEISEAKRILDSIQDREKIPSVSIAVALDNQIVWTYAVGYQDIENEIVSDTSTQYRIGSVSKAITSLGLAKLVEQGKIHLDSSVQFYSGLFEEKPKITIRQLASHTSGIRNYGVCFCFPIFEYYRNKRFDDIKSSVLDFENDKLLFTPGTEYSYSSYNYTALSLAMEYASQTRFDDYMHQEVFHPLGMKNTSFKPEVAEQAQIAIPYESNAKYFKTAPRVDLSNKLAGGGIMSTPSDLVRAGGVLLDSSFLSRKTIDNLTRPQLLDDGNTNPENYALGWRHGYSERYFGGKKKVQVIHHGGMAVGGQALLIVYPEYGMVVALTMNKSGQQGDFRLFDYVMPLVDPFLRNIHPLIK